jgi:hypothetical protein
MSEDIVLAIDPSINDVGFVYMTKKGSFISSKHLVPQKGCLNVVEKVTSISKQIEHEIKNSSTEIGEIVIEHTRYFAQNQRTSHASAQKLNLVKGAIYGVCLCQNIKEVRMVWIPGFKKENANLLARSFSLPKVTQHERDAFWLGYTWLNSPKVIRQAWLENPGL